MNELIINNRRLDLSDSTNIGVTFCANNIGELQNRQGNFTNTFKLPITKNNKEILEYSNLQTSSSLMPYNKLKATYRQDGVEIVVDGVAEISSVDNDFFYVNFYSGNVDLMEAIGDVTVGELYKDDIVYNWNIQSIYNPDINDYYIYPLIDWRKDIDTFFTTDSVDMTQMLPCATIPKFFDRLANYTGFNFIGNYLNSANYKSMILTPNSFYIPKSDAIKTSQPLSTIGTTGGTIIPSGSSVSTVTYLPTFRNESNLTEFNTGTFKPTINKIGKLKFAGTYQIKWVATASKLYENTKDCFVKISFIDDLNNVVYNEFVKTLTFDKDTLISEVFTVDIESPELSFLSIRNYRVQIDCLVQQKNVTTQFLLYQYEVFKDTGSPIGFFSPGSTTTNVFPRYYQFTPSAKITFDTPIDFTKIFTMKVKDVLKDILNMEAIIIQTNNYTKTIQFNKFEDVNLNKQMSKDWSRKIQSSKSMSFKFGNYAKKNNFKFKTESENDWSFYLPQENLDTEKDVVKLGHDATFQYNRYNGYIIPTIDALKDGSNEWNNPTYRLLNLKIQNTEFNVKYTYGTDIYNKNTNVPFCHFKDANTLIDENYNSIVGILKSPKVLKIVTKLDVTDISDLDFSIPIQINRADLNLSGYFYINKIENYKGNLTSCEIIEI